MNNRLKSIENLKAELEALEVEYKANLKKSEEIDLLQSGSIFGSNRKICQDKYLPKLNVLEDELFVLEWTLEVTVSRRQAWADDVVKNQEEYQKLGFHTFRAKIEQKNGFKDFELKRAIEMHNLKNK